AATSRGPHGVRANARTHLRPPRPAAPAVRSPANAYVRHWREHRGCFCQSTTKESPKRSPWTARKVPWWNPERNGGAFALQIRKFRNRPVEQNVSHLRSRYRQEFRGASRGGIP